MSNLFEIPDLWDKLVGGTAVCVLLTLQRKLGLLEFSTLVEKKNQKENF